ncbi:MAG TPA: hypothetical protein ENK52_03360 [Saprospiraceae bacterium]|nr:hypothetical protein [Saprospiraceae bacterium]
MKKLSVLFPLFLILIFTSCNSKKIKELELQLANKTEQVKSLEDQIDFLKNTNNSLLGQMEDLSIVSKTGAESIKKSLESMTQQYEYIQDLNTNIRKKDSLNLTLVMNLKRSLSDINDEDIQVEVREGVVYVSISDKLLFKSGSAKISPNAQHILEKLSLVINDHDDINVMVEGHTDDVPFHSGCMLDNWDLSVKRATAVVRALQEDYLIDPARLTAAGRSEYAPKEDNLTPEGRSANRRTEIIITPKLDQFFKLLAPAEMAN